MDYKDLANLIYKDAKNIEYYNGKIPERNLEKSNCYKICT